MKQAEQFPILRRRLLGRRHIASKTRVVTCLKSTAWSIIRLPMAGMRVADFMWTNLGLHFENPAGQQNL